MDNNSEEIRQNGEETAQVPPNVPLKVLIPKGMVGSLIGKGGQTIRDMSSDTGAKIHISQTEDAHLPERVVIVSGSIENIASAQFSIFEKMQKETYAAIEDVEQIPNAPPMSKLSLQALRMLVPNTLIGKLIGKNRVNIRKIQIETDTYIYYPVHEEFTFRGERVVSVVGTVENQNKAMKLILQQIDFFIKSHHNNTQNPNHGHHENSSNKPPNRFDPNFVSSMNQMRPTGSRDPMFEGSPVMFPVRDNFRQPHVGLPPFMPPPFGADMNRPMLPFPTSVDTVCIFVPNESVGALIGRSGSSIRELSRQSRSKLRVARNEEIDDNATHRHVHITGPFESQVKAQTMIFHIIRETLPSLGPNPACTVNMMIPVNTVGRVIGKKGSQVKRITEYSGARLTVNQDGEENDESTVCIFGSLDQQITAQQMIQEILTFHKPETRHSPSYNNYGSPHHK